MAGKVLPQFSNNDYSDPFNAGQMVGIMVMLTFIEQNGGITADTIDQIKTSCARNIEDFLQKPSEDIFLMIDNMVKEINENN